MAKTQKVNPRDFEPPAELSPRSKATWCAMVAKGFTGPQTLAAMRAALRDDELADKAQATLDAEGLQVTNRKTGIVHTHPMLAVQAAARRRFTRLWATLTRDHALTHDDLAAIKAHTDATLANLKVGP